MCYALKRKLFANIACLALLSYVCGWPKRMFTIYRNIREYSRTYGKYTASAPCLSLYICCMSLYSFHILLLFGWRVERQYGDWCKCERVFVCEYARGEPADINLSWAHNNQTIATACAYIQRNIVLLFDVAIGCISACLSVCLRVLSSPEHAVTGHCLAPIAFTLLSPAQNELFQVPKVTILRPAECKSNWLRFHAYCILLRTCMRVYMCDCGRLDAQCGESHTNGTHEPNGYANK